MGDVWSPLTGLFGGGDGDDEDQLQIYGELPGAGEIGGDLSQALRRWLQSYMAGGAGLPSTGEERALWSGAWPGAQLGQQRLQEILSPGWLTETAPGLQQIEEAEAAQTERDIERMRREILMRFGRAGQTLSSPMVRALTEGELGARQELMGRTGERRLGTYQQRLGMMPGLLAMAIQQPYQAARLLGQGGTDLIQALLSYLGASRGQAFYVPRSQGTDWMQLLPFILSAAG